MSAQRARGADFETGNLIQRAKALVPLLVPLFISAFRRADELAVAMECRCYHGGEGRTRLRQLKYTGRMDMAVICSVPGHRAWASACWGASACKPSFCTEFQREVYKFPVYEKYRPEADVRRHRLPRLAGAEKRRLRGGDPGEGPGHGGVPPGEVHRRGPHRRRRPRRGLCGQLPHRLHHPLRPHPPGGEHPPARRHRGGQGHRGARWRSTPSAPACGRSTPTASTTPAWATPSMWTGPGSTPSTWTRP